MGARRAASARTGGESTAAAAARRAAHLCEAGTEEGLLLPALLDEVDQLPRGVRVDLGAHALGGDREGHLENRELREGGRVREHLPAEDAEGVDVAAGAVRLVPDHLRGGRQMRRWKGCRLLHRAMAESSRLSLRRSYGLGADVYGPEV